MNNNNADISLPNYTDIHPILSDIESFLSSMRDLSVSVDGFDTEGLDLDGLDSDVPGIKNNIKAVLSDDSEINETYESLKRIADLLQMTYMSSIEQIIEENEYLKPYLDLLMNLNGDDFFAIYQDFDKLLSDYNIELKDLEKQIDQEKYSSITYVNVNGVNLPVQTSSGNSTKLKSLEDERNELIQAMYIVKQLRDLNLNSAYNTCMQNDDYNINSTSKIASYKTIYHEGDTYGLYGENYGGSYSVVFYDKDGNEINPSYIDQAIYFYQSGEPSYLMPLHALDKEVSDYYQNMSYLLPNELGIMEYLSNTGDVDKLNTYISLKMDEASSRHGQQLANNMTQKIDGFYENNDDATAYALTLAYLSGNGLVDGLKTFATGIYYLFDADANVPPDQYKTMYLMQYLKDRYDENKIAEIVSTGSYEISSSIGNMIPSIGLNLLVPGSGLAAMGLSAAGNARKQGLQQGMSEGAAWVYGILSGTSEALLEKYLGAIPGLSNLGRFAEFGGIKGFLAKMASEGLEESVQAILEPLFATIVTNGKIPFEVDWREVAKSGIYGMITAGIMNGGEGVIKMTVGGISYSIASTEVNGLIEEFKGQDLTDPKVQEELKQRLSGMEEANKLSGLNITEEQATELIERSNTEDVNVSEELKNIRAENIKAAQDAKTQKLAEDKLAEEARSDTMKENFERIASEDGLLINPNIAKLFTFKHKPEKASELTDVNLDDDLAWEDEIVDDEEDEVVDDDLTWEDEITDFSNIDSNEKNISITQPQVEMSPREELASLGFNDDAIEFIISHNIDYNGILDSEEGKITTIYDINPLLRNYGMYEQEEAAYVSVADILGRNDVGNNNVLLTMGMHFDSDIGDSYHTRSLGMLEYHDGEELIKGLADSFKHEPMHVNQVGDGQYIMGHNGMHRFTLLRIYYLNELLQNNLEQSALREKYVIPVNLSRPNYFKTYSNFILQMFDANIKDIWQIYDDGILLTDVRLKLRDGTETIVSENDLKNIVELTLSNVDEYDMRTIKEYYELYPSFKNYIDNNFSEFAEKLSSIDLEDDVW